MKCCIAYLKIYAFRIWISYTLVGKHIWVEIKYFFHKNGPKIYFKDIIWVAINLELNLFLSFTGQWMQNKHDIFNHL